MHLYLIFVKKTTTIYIIIIRKANELGSDELPESWQEVQDGAELFTGIYGLELSSMKGQLVLLL